MGVHATRETGRAMSVAPSYVRRVLRLTPLAPEMVEAILDGRQPAAFQLDFDEEAGAGRACLVETLALPGDTPVLVAGEPFEAVMAAVHEDQATPAIRSTGSIVLTTRPIGRSRSCARRVRRQGFWND